MRILVDLNHPAHVHLFKHAIRAWQARGDEVLITARDKDVTLDLLDNLRFEYQRTTRARRGWLGFVGETAALDWRVLRAARAFNPDFLIGTSFAIAHVSRLVSGRSVVFAEDDVGSSRLFWTVTGPFADFIVTPRSIPDDFGDKHIRYAGCQELAYLHPNQFKPDVSVLSEQGLEMGEPFSILRFVSLEAIHDVGQRGISAETARQLVEVLGEKGRVIISSEGKLPAQFEPLRLQIRPERLHDLLARAQVLVSDSQSMTIEAAVLGVPSVRINSFVGGTPVVENLEQSYGLTFGFRPEMEAQAIEKVRELVREPDSGRWQERREHYLRDSVDVTPWIIQLIDNLHAA